MKHLLFLLLLTLQLFANIPTYDKADNRLIKTTYPDGSTTTNSYDEAGRLISTTDANGNTTTYEYDAVGNKISTTNTLGRVSGLKIKIHLAIKQSIDPRGKDCV